MRGSRWVAGCWSCAGLSSGPESPIRCGTRCRRAARRPRRCAACSTAKTELVFVWGGDGMLQRCIDVAAGSDIALAIVPAGTSNLLATNLGVPVDIEQAIQIGLDGERRRLDVGRFNGERFAVMAGSGMDATMIRNADGGLKDRLGRAALRVGGAEGRTFEVVRCRDRGGRCRLVPRRCDVGSDRQRRRADRPRRSLRGLTARRRLARGRRRHRRGVHRLDADGRTDRHRGRRGVAVRTGGKGSHGQSEARSKGPLRARRRRSDEGEVVQGQGRARGRHAVRSSP